jgi:hypothetical protein
MFARSVALVVSAATSLEPLFAQNSKKLCQERLASYPILGSIDSPVDQRARFEIRTCDGPSIQLAGFKAGELEPTLLINTDQPAVSLLIHTGTILFVQLVAGSSSPTYILQMRRGTPELVVRLSGVGGVAYRMEHPREGDFAVFSIPLKTYPDETGKFPNTPPRVIRLKVWD